MHDNRPIRENTEDSKNPSGRPPHDLLRARAHEQQAAGESSSMRNKHSDRGRFPSSEQEGHLTVADRTRLDLPPIMVTIEKHISEHDKKLWEKQCSENSMRLDEHENVSEKWKTNMLNRFFEVARDARSEASSSSHDQDAQATLPQMSQDKKDNLEEDGLKKSKMVLEMIESSKKYVKANLTRAIDDWALHHQQIAARICVEGDTCNKATRLEYITQDPEVKAYHAKRWKQLDKQWGKVIKGWAENYNWITKDRIRIIRGDLGVTNKFDNVFKCDAQYPYRRYEKIEIAIRRLIPDDTKRLFELQFAYFRKKQISDYYQHQRNRQSKVGQPWRGEFSLAKEICHDDAYFHQRTSTCGSSSIPPSASATGIAPQDQRADASPASRQSRAGHPSRMTPLPLRRPSTLTTN